MESANGNGSGNGVGQRPTVLVLCTGNSCRSQMAEAILRRVVDGAVNVASAGSKPSGYVHEMAKTVMAEAGYDLEEARSKSLEEFLEQEVETVITVCGNADQVCPQFPGQRRRYHWAFDDPADATGADEEVAGEFRRIRDEIDRVFTAYGRGLADASGR